MSAINAALDELMAWWRDPSRRLGEYVAARQVSALNAERHQKNPALLAQLDELEAERRRLQSLLMDGHPVAPEEIAALAQRVERLRRDFAALMT